MSIEITIRCDDCGVVGADKVWDAKLVRAALRAFGWRYFRRKKDLCPKCEEKRQARECERNPHGYF